MYRGLLALVALLALAGCVGIAPAVDDGITHEQRPAPESETLGYHDGYWHDDPVAVNATDGLNATEREAVTARTIARVEYIRGLEFDEDVNVSVVSRANFSEAQRNRTTDGETEAFEDGKFAALFMVGDDESATQSQQETTGDIVNGFYNPSTGDIVVVSETDTPDIDTSTLAHELTHALQDQQFNLTETQASYPHDRRQGRLGLIEGDASVVETEYDRRCGEEWTCVSYPDNDSQPEQPDLHWGLYFASFFPYSDGPTFTESLRDGDDWSGVNAAYERPPNSTAEVIDPAKYGRFEPENVTLRDTGEWDRVRRPDAPDYEVLGQSALAAMFAYTLYDDSNPNAVVTPEEFLNMEGGQVNETDPLNYGLGPTRGWTGDRLHVYERDGELAYVWRLTWDTDEDARRFTDTYHDLLGYWGGQRVAGDVWELREESPFAGAYRVNTTGDTVTVTHAPSRGELDAVYDATATGEGRPAPATAETTVPVPVPAGT